MNTFTITKGRAATLCDIFVAIGQVFFASILIEPVVTGATNWLLVISGMVLSSACWVLSIYFTK
jgi:hypothetical protein